MSLTNKQQFLEMSIGSGGGGIGSGGPKIPSKPPGIGSSPPPIGSSSIRSNALTVDGGLIADPNMRRTDLDSLHPVMREATLYLLRKLEAEGIPLRLFESFRSPARQAWLYAQGRTRAGAIVSNAKPWESYHQYGLAADFVLWIEGSWSWSTAGVHTMYWKRLHKIGEEVGLEPLSWETPHLQVAGLALQDLKKGIFPDGGDDAWRDNLEAVAIGWDSAKSGLLMASPRPPAPKS